MANNFLLTMGKARKSASPRRARLSLQSNASADASRQNVEEHEADAEAEGRPRKRGRPRKSLDSNAEALPTDPNPKPRKRGRPSSLGAKEGPAPAAEGPLKSKRGRPQRRGNEVADKAGGQQIEPSSPTRKKATKEKKPRVSLQEADEPQQAEEQQAPAKRKRGRPSLQDAATAEANTNSTRAAKSGEDQGTEAVDGAPSRKRGRPTQNRTTPGDQETDPSRRRSTAAVVEESEQPETSTRRRSSQIAQLEAEAPPNPYAHIVPRIRGVKQSTIDAKWRPLSDPSIAAATETLALAHRPIMQRLASTHQRRQHTSSALSLLHRRISRKLHRGLPFPPPAALAAAGGGRRKKGRRGRNGGHEAELDFESVLGGSRALQRQLDPALHAVELLRKEKERMERELERDYKTLRNLEAGARGQARQQREQLKKAHVLAPEAAVAREKREEDVEMVFDDGNGSLPPGAVFKVRG